MTQDEELESLRKAVLGCYYAIAEAIEGLCRIRDRLYVIQREEPEQSPGRDNKR